MSRHNWIKGALRRGRRGALHRKLRVPAGEAIPVKKLRAAAKKPGKTGRQARFALTMRKLSRKRHKKHHGKHQHKRSHHR